MGRSRKCGRRFRVRTQDPRVLEGTLCWEKNAGPPLYSRRSIRERLLANAQSEVCRAQWVCTYLVMFFPPPHPHLHKGGGGTGPMAPPPAVTPQVSRPSSSMAQTPTPARSTKTAPQQRLQSSSPLPPLHHFQHKGEQAWQSHQAATVLQYWKWRIWLRRWSDQQAMSKQKRLRLQTLCRGASTYASSVRGNRRPPPTRPKRPLDPKVLSHPFRTRGQPLPPRKRGQRHKRLRRRPGRRHWPLAPDSVCH
jgi:hypothetical protein